MKSRITARFVFGAFVLLLVPLGIAWSLASPGTVEVCEFSARTLEHRLTRSYQAFGFDLVELGTVTWNTHLADYLAAQGYLGGVEEDWTDWRFVKGFAPGVRGWHGQAKRMCWSLGCWDREDAKWVTWSKAHPVLSRVLWPKVIGQIRSRNYDSARHTLWIAESAPEDLVAHLWSPTSAAD